MGQVPDRNPVYMSEISAALGGENNLGYYRGRQYWNAGGAAITISQSPSMNEFRGITNVAPYVYNGTLYSRYYTRTILGTVYQYWGFAVNYGDLQPRYVAAMGTNIVGATNTLAGGVWRIVLGVSGNIGNGYFSAYHIPNVVWLNRADALYGYDSNANQTTWSWQVGGQIQGVADYNLRLE